MLDCKNLDVFNLGTFAGDKSNMAFVKKLSYMIAQGVRKIPTPYPLPPLQTNVFNRKQRK